MGEGLKGMGETTDTARGMTVGGETSEKWRRECLPGFRMSDRRMPPVVSQVGRSFMPIRRSGQDGQQELPVDSQVFCCFYTAKGAGTISARMPPMYRKLSCRISACPLQLNGEFPRWCRRTEELFAQAAAVHHTLYDFAVLDDAVHLPIDLQLLKCVQLRR